MEKWIWHNKEGINYITLPIWQESGIGVLFSSRQGGVSEGPFYSLNLGLHVGDDVKRVLENRQKVLHVLGTSLDNAVCCEQVHDSEVAVVTKEHRGSGTLEFDTALASYDAMITNETNVYLMTYYADCYSLYFYDPIKKVVGLAHSGWKGTVLGIAAKTISKMSEVFKTSPSSIQVFIGPGIGECCFEISPDLASRVEKELSYLGLGNLVSERDASFYWDLKETNRRLLIENGIKPEHITICGLCTSCNKDHFFSYRRDKGITGRMAAVIGIRE